MSSHPPRSRLARWLRPGFLLLLGACGEGPGEPGGARSTAALEAAQPAEHKPEPARAAPDPRLRSLHAALERGAPAEARAALAALGAELALERRIAEARLAALEGRELEAARLIERARELDPDAPEVYASAAEIAAGGGRFQSAWAELRRGEERCGAERPELLRARGVLWISRQGGAKKGLALLEEARAKEPELAFLSRPLSQAHLLLAREALASGDVRAARESAELALAHDPTDVETRRVVADCRAAAGDLDGAAFLLEELAAQGVPLGAEPGLALKRAALLRLLEGDREGALERFARARAAGLDDEALGSGAGMLAEEASRRVERGVERFRAGEREEALEDFRAALQLDPGSLEAQNHSAVVCWSLGRASEAVDAWRALVRRAHEEALELPEPVHVHLARALLVLGEREGALDVLAEHLERVPASRWTDETRELLEELEGAR